jgi:integrase/recombinase XerD
MARKTRLVTVSKDLVPIEPVSGALSIATPAADALTGFLSESTKRAYGRDFKDFFGTDDIGSLNLERLRAVSPKDVQLFRDRLLSQKMAPSTVQRKLSAIRSLFNYLMARGAIIANPAHPKLVRAPKKSTIRTTDALTWEETVRFLSTMDRATWVGRRDYAIFLLSANCAFRRAEILSIRLEDMKKEPNGEVLFIVRGKGEKIRRVPFGRQDLVAALKDYLTDRGDAPGYLFYGRRGPLHPLDASWLYRIMAKYAGEAGLQQKIGVRESTGNARWKLHPHSLRAGYIFFSLEKNVPIHRIQEIVGHSRGETTLGYVRDYQSTNGDAVRALDGLSATPTTKPKVFKQ